MSRNSISISPFRAARRSTPICDMYFVSFLTGVLLGVVKEQKANFEETLMVTFRHLSNSGVIFTPVSGNVFSD